VLLVLITSLILYMVLSPCSHTECNANFLQSFVPEGFSIEEHRVETVDHYFIRLFRIVHHNNKTPRGSPLFVQHGLSCTPIMSIVNTIDKSPALAAAYAG